MSYSFQFRITHADDPESDYAGTITDKDVVGLLRTWADQIETHPEWLADAHINFDWTVELARQQITLLPQWEPEPRPRTLTIEFGDMWAGQATDDIDVAASEAAHDDLLTRRIHETLGADVEVTIWHNGDEIGGFGSVNPDGFDGEINDEDAIDSVHAILDELFNDMGLWAVEKTVSS